MAAATPLRQVPIEIYAVASCDLKAVAISPRKGKSAILSSLNLRVAHFLDIPKRVNSSNVVSLHSLECEMVRSLVISDLDSKEAFLFLIQ